MSVSIAIVMLCCLAISSGNQINIADNIPTPTQQYTHSVLLNEDRFNLYWNFNNTHVTFEVLAPIFPCAHCHATFELKSRAPLNMPCFCLWNIEITVQNLFLHA